MVLVQPEMSVKGGPRVSFSAPPCSPQTKRKASLTMAIHQTSPFMNENKTRLTRFMSSSTPDSHSQKTTYNTEKTIRQLSPTTCRTLHRLPTPLYHEQRKAIKPIINYSVFEE